MSGSSYKQTYSLISVEKASDTSRFSDSEYKPSVSGSSNVSMDECDISSNSRNATSIKVESNSQILSSSAMPKEISYTEIVSADSILESSAQTKNSRKDNTRAESALDDLSEDDLKGGAPLENVHKIILAVLVFGLIAFAVYFVVFM